ncbi:hypothetical protein ACTWJ9_33100 (plasmid) [Streptomyces sp. GDS52]|uniref:hypothetical protein n=1 Tax=Streptomyces sp. GDS52 TaxID=3406419 RepID=UPI003FD5CD62
MDRNHAPATQADESDGTGCVAARYVGVPDSYDGSSFCGCPDCIEYVGERQYEDEV